MVLSKEKFNFQSVIEIVESLSDNEQEHLIKIINHRLKQKEKEELLRAVQDSREAFIKGEVKSGTVADLMADLEEE
jgi:RecG-like helicase